MTVPKRVLIVIFALAVFAAAFVLKGMEGGGQESPNHPAEAAALPRLLDLGSDKCVPCKLMAPILQELKSEYAGRMVVDFVDVRVHKEIGTEYGLKVIPTQIFFAADGTELFRHEGFMSKEDILARWDELGVDLGTSGVSEEGR
jgi:thioredoxin 1